MKWKVCGMREPNNVSDVAALEPDYMGFILWEGSKRYCPTPTTLPDGVAKVGVFVNASIEEIIDAISQHKLDVVQLHGDETPKFCRELLGKAEIIKAFSVGDSFDFDALIDYVPYCDFFLFDTKGAMPGGNGTCFDWEILNNYPFDTPFFISGGIGLAEVPSITELCKSDLPVFAIDINSKFEHTPANKDVESLAVFKEKLAL
jgi:phosphoribosylanthranilate isomerase